jgi:hypothetical protein
VCETLAAGVAVRTVTTQDLNIPDPPAGADPQMAAGFRLDTTPPVLPVNGFAATGPAANPGPTGLMPLLPAGAASTSPATSLVSAQPAGSVQAVAISPTGPASSLVSQGADQENGRGLSPKGNRAGNVHDAVLADLAAEADRWRGEEGAGTSGILEPDPVSTSTSTDPMSQPPARHLTQASASVLTAFARGVRIVPQVEHDPIRAGVRTGSACDVVLGELAADAAELRSRIVTGRSIAPALPSAGGSDTPVMGDPIAPQGRPAKADGLLPRLAVTLLAARLWCQGTGMWHPRSRRAGERLQITKSR